MRDYMVAVGVGGTNPGEPDAWDNLAREVKSRMANGWEPHGGVAVDAGKRSDGSRYVYLYQAMIKP